MISFYSEGEEWQNVRSLLAKHMLRPKSVEMYDGPLNSVVSDLINKLKLRLQHNANGVVTDIAREFYRFGLEGMSSYWHVLHFDYIHFSSHIDQQN